MKLDPAIGGQIKCLTSNQIVSFRFSEVMKENFQISEGDPLEFSLAHTANNGVRYYHFPVTESSFSSIFRIYLKQFESN